jgi:hypothetical protein
MSREINITVSPQGGRTGYLLVREDGQMWPETKYREVKPRLDEALGALAAPTEANPATGTLSASITIYANDQLSWLEIKARAAEALGAQLTTEELR